MAGNWFFLLLVPLYLAASLWSQTVSSNVADSALGGSGSPVKHEEIPVTATLDELIARIKKSADQIMKQKLQRTKEIYKLGDIPSHHRTRRSIPDQLSRVQHPFYELVSIQTLSGASIPGCTDVESFALYNNQYIVATNISSREQTVLYKYNNGTSTVLEVVETADVKDVAVLQMEDRTMLVVMESNSDTAGLPTGTVIYEFKNATQRFHFIQRVFTNDPKQVEGFSLNGVEYLILAGAFVENVGAGIQRRVSAIHRWEGGHFDQIATFITGDAVDVHPFQIHSQVFLAVANSTDSHILIFNPNLEAFVRYQDIDITHAVDWEHFKLGDGIEQDYFLAVATRKDGPSKSIIYKYHRNEFVPFQSILATGARVWHAVKNPDGTLRALALSSDDGINFYQYNGWRFELSTIKIPQPGGSVDMGVQSMTSFIESGRVVLVVADNSTLVANVFELKFRTNHAVQQLHRDASLSCIHLRSKVASLKSRLNSTQNAADNLVYVNSSKIQVVTGNKTFLDDVSMYNVKATEIHADNGMILDAKEKVQFAEVRSNQTQSFTDLNTIEQRLHGAMNKTGPQQTVTGQKNFTQMMTPALDVNTVNVGSDIINKNVNLTELVTNTWHKDTDQMIDVAVSISGNVTVQGSLTVSGLLDGVDTSIIVTLSRDHTIEGSKTFDTSVQVKGNLDVSQNIDGVRVSESNLLLTYGNQTIQYHLNVSGVVTFLNNVEVDGLVDGCDLSTINRDAVLTSGNITVTGNKNFTGDLTPEKGITMGAGHTIDGVDILQLDRTVLKTTGYQQLTGNYNFSQSVDIYGNLSVDGLVDGLSIPGDILVENSARQAVLAENWGVEDITAENITVETSIDGILATGGGTGLEVMLVNGGSQTLEGAISFAVGMRLEGSSQVTGLVDGVDIPSMTAEAVYKNGDQEITGEKTFASDVTFQFNLLVELLINGINVTQYESSAVKLFGEDDVIVFNGDVELTASETKMAGPLITAGNHSFPYKRSLQDLIIQGREDTIYGFKSFPDVSSLKDVEATLVNGINISRFFQESVRVIPGIVLVIDDNVTFWYSVNMNGNLSIQSQIIDGTYIPDIVTIAGNSSVASMTTFTGDITARNLWVDTLTLSGLLNGYDVQAVNNDTLKKNTAGTQVVTGQKTFLNGLTINGDLVVNNNTVGVDLSAVANDSVYTNDAYTVITAAKTFGFANITHLNATDHIDGVHLPSFSQRVVIQTIPQTIQGTVTFNQDVDFANDIIVAQTVNGHSVTSRLLGVLNILNSSYEVEVEFSDVVCGGNVTLDGLIDGFKMNNFVLKVAEFQPIKGDKRFKGSLTITETAVVLLINGVSIDDLNGLAVRHNETETISGNKTFARGISLQQNLTVTMLVDTVDVQALQANALATRSDFKLNQIVLGNGTLGNIIVLGNLTCNCMVDGVNPEQLKQSFMSLTIPQTVTGYKILQDTLTIASPASLDADTILLDGNLNEVDLEDFAASVWVGGRGDEVIAVKTFTENATLRYSLTVGGTINGLDVGGNAMVTDQSNTVTGIKTFTGSPLTVNGRINMTGWMEVDGVDLSEYKKNAATTRDDHNITFPTGAAGIILQSNLEVDGEIDGVNVSGDNLLLTAGSQNITGIKTFSQDVNVSPNIILNALLNGIDLVDLFLNTLLISPNQTIVGTYTFYDNLILSNVTTLPDVLVDGIRIQELYRHVYTYPTFEEFNRSLQLRCDMLNKMHEAQENAAVLLIHLDTVQVIDTVGSLSWHAFYFNDTQWLVAAQKTTYPDTDCVGSNIYQWNETTNNYQYYQTLYPKTTVDVDSFVMNDRLFLIFAGKHNDTGQCDNFTRLFEGDDVDGIITLNRTSVPSDFYSYSTTNVLVWLPDSETFYLYQALPCVSPSDVEVFVDPLTNQTCVAIANEVHVDSNGDFFSVLPSYVYCLEDLENGFYLKDNFTTAGARSIKHFFKDGILHLAVANRLTDITDSFVAESAIFQQSSNGSFIQVATTEGTATLDVLPITIEDNWYIVLANEFSGTLNKADYDVPVSVYKYSDSSTLVLEQELSAFGARALGSYSTGDESFIIVVDQVTTSVYKFQGVDLFVKIHTLDTYGATSFHVFPLGDTGRVQAALAAYEEEDLLFEGQEVHALPAPSLILEFILIGEKVPSLSCSY
ncbi:uncharacterized protein LOC110980413 [Acanthaster planci]|uniref:Uncharacterized protein LOC110980413 n=1 Tax=Acanthaster planci TaxID=133434 RepID=A0A8B7YHN0_ACAPL|nr:uncharacterized protein LOC110980413 [Acanthaster planci]